ncbi:hypothetical protein LOTGIDRAFT_171756 [Lottia gigantea]|uniref:H-type lectin domain-containing protein n=1 Tax=Lottia gigantea TaxID=225164 RepID=V4AGI0_LOTGI|nr:hypothetical protein LOTGIDRAFT_171756 [Lottia gigantea]ESP03149.1 hypothetical protein LOTGIDRAFT_171756 [Lottia gigantea]
MHVLVLLWEIYKWPDIQEEFDFPFFPDFSKLDGGTGDDNSVFATPDGFPINPEEFGLDWETILNEPSITEIHKNLTNLEHAVILVQEEQFEIKRGVDLVLEEMGTLRAEMRMFQRSINDSMTDVMKKLHKQDKSLSHERKLTEKLQHKIRLMAEMPVSQSQIQYMKNATDSAIDYTRKQVQKVRKKMSSLDNSWSKFRLSWGNRLKDIGSIARESRGTGKQHTLDINNLAANVSSLRNGVRGLQLLSGKDTLSSNVYHRGGCDAGTVSFSNYPFNSANWPQRKKIRFKQDFPFVPKVGYGVTAMDTSYRYNTRIRIQVERVTRQSFVLYCSGWHNSRLYQVEVAWMAC